MAIIGSIGAPARVLTRAVSAAAGAVVPGGPSCPLFSMQLLVSVTGMGLSVVMLAMGRDPAVYLPVLTSIVGYWLPAPRRPAAEPAPEDRASVASVNRGPVAHEIEVSSS